MSVKVSSKYQVVIPEEVRNRLGLKPGSNVDVLLKGRIAYIVPIPTLAELQQQLQGKIDTHALRDKEKDQK